MKTETITNTIEDKKIRITYDDIFNEKSGIRACKGGLEWFSHNKLHELDIPLNSTIRVDTEFEYSNLTWMLNHPAFIANNPSIFDYISRIECYIDGVIRSSVDYSQVGYISIYDTEVYSSCIIDYNKHGIMIEFINSDKIINLDKHNSYDFIEILRSINSIDIINDEDIDDITEPITLSLRYSNDITYIKTDDNRYLSTHILQTSNFGKEITEVTAEYSADYKIVLSEVVNVNGVDTNVTKNIVDSLGRIILNSVMNERMNTIITYIYYKDTDLVLSKNESLVYKESYLEETNSKNKVLLDDGVQIKCDISETQQIINEVVHDYNICTLQIFPNKY